MIDTSQYLHIPIEESLRIRHAFDQYANSFRKNDDMGYNRHMDLKQQHTYRVVQEAIALGKSLKMSLEQIAFTEVLALLHDIGRFEQFNRYATFADAESENHSEMAIRITEELDLLKGFPKEQVEIIYRSILNHNVPKVPDEEPPKTNFYSRLLRDADKLDIWRVTLEYNIFHTIKTESFPDSYLPPAKLISYFNNFECIPLKEVGSFYDSILFRLSWLFDLNFHYSFDQFMKRNITGHLFKKLPQTDGLEPIARAVYKYVRKVSQFA